MQQNLIQTIITILVLVPLLIIWQRLRIKRLKKYFSKNLGNIYVDQKYNGEKMLSINVYPQGVSTEDDSIKKSYWFCIAKQAVKFCNGRKNPQVLMLGLGANTISDLIGRMNPNIHQTIVEFDDAIIQACKDFFNLEKLPNHTLIKTDAYKLIDHPESFKKRFDVIIVDIFTGNPPFISLKSNRPNFIRQTIKYLKKDGMIIFNRPAHIPEARNDSQKLKQYLSTIFKNTKLFYIKDPRGYQNNVITGLIQKVSIPR